MIGYIKKYGVEIILILAYICIMSLVAQIMYTPYNPPSLNIEKKYDNWKICSCHAIWKLFESDRTLCESTVFY